MKFATASVALGALIAASLISRPVSAQNDVFGQILQGFAQGMQQSQQNQGGYNRNQWGSNNQWGNNNNQWGNQNRNWGSSSQRGRNTIGSNWVERVPKYDGNEIYGYEDRVNVGNIITDIGRLAEQGNQNTYPDNRRYPQPQYYPPQQRYVQPQYVQPQPQVRPQPVATAAPAKNVVKQAAKRPKKNDGTLALYEGSAMSAEFDARQANEASKASGKLDTAITDEVAKSGDPQMEKDWNDAVLSGDPDKIQEFKDKYDGKLTEDTKKAIDLRAELADYEQDLSNGLLTGPGKDQRIQEINDKFKDLPNGALKDNVGDNLAQMDKFNELGKLSELAQDSDNPWDTMVQGTQNAGYPVSFLAEVSGMPIMTDPVHDSSASGSATTVILNPESNGRSVNYKLGPHAYNIGPGQSQYLEKSYTISFDSGKGGGVKKYTLGSGTYKFVRTDGSWDLRQTDIAVSIDNSQYDGAFHYLVDGQDAVLQPGQIADLTSELPIVVEFDQGNGGKPARKVLTEGTFLVGVDATQQRLDLFAADNGSLASIAQSSGVDSETTQVFTTSKPRGAATDKAKKIQEALARLKAKG